MPPNELPGLHKSGAVILRSSRRAITPLIAPLAWTYGPGYNYGLGRNFSLETIG